MTELKRWTEDGAPESVMRLLEAASNERPSQASLAKSLSAAAIGLGTLAGSSAASGAALGVATKTALFAGATWLKTGVFVTGFAVATAGGIYATKSPPSVTRPAASASLPLAANPVPRVPEIKGTSAVPTQLAAPAAPAPAGASARPLSVSSKAAPEESVLVEDADQLAEEVRAVDEARAAVAAGRSLQALRLLDGYDSRYPARGFAPESLYLRMRALVALGRGEEARAIAARLAKSYPATPQAARARELLKDPIP